MISTSSIVDTAILDLAVVTFLIPFVSGKRTRLIDALLQDKRHPLTAILIALEYVVTECTMATRRRLLLSAS
jgi:hypothetical protein